MLEETTDIRFVKGVGEQRAKLFKKLGVETVADLVRLYPRSYRDLTNLRMISECVPGEVCSVRAVVNSTPVGVRVKNGITLYKTEATDGRDVVHLTYFNNRYIPTLLQGGREYIFTGKLNLNRGRYEMLSPVIDNLSSAGRMMPVYPQTAGLTSRVIESVMRNALAVYSPGYETLPESLREKYKLCPLGFAVRNIHFPENAADALAAKKRLMFEELLVLQLGMAKLKNHDRGFTDAVIKTDYTEEFLEKLPFTLTIAQSNAISDGIRDMGLHEPMNRLLQGDVGSGKTCVAAALVYTAAKNGIQSALMAPTGILATQHYRSFLSFFEGTGIRTALLLGSMKAKEKCEIKQKIADGEIDLVIGTHAIIQKDVSFRRLGLVITDEQHRFGVAQRMSLASKGDNPHTLVMSATPIPRTLALIIYGDLDLSVLDELPPGRQTVDTYVVDSSYHERVYAFIRKYLDRGFQAYIVCPLVEESESADYIGAVEYSKKLRSTAFRDYPTGLLHGKMKQSEKDSVMADFVSGKTKLLIATTVIEVGVDVPNAVIMVIEDADRFGLSQLHQLRGRVGRGSEKSSCILISDAKSPAAKKRLEIMKKSNDGFRIADEDLRLRGPGDFFGEKQHGLPALHIADMLDDMVLCNRSAEAAKELLADDPMLEKEENSSLDKEIKALFKDKYIMN
ncbi:MAG: ATP-dependent DNA helicase RecG [Oscillospiraceae bacterium]|nr:ATP-dependent DNA helicase RecG [Oscillospiraceae bacterium]